MRNLTEQQQRILDYIVRCIKYRHSAPTRIEIAESFGFSSPNAAQCHLKALEKKGRIAIAGGKVSRGITVLREA